MELKVPFLSIIIPTYGRPNQLSACLKSLARLDYHRDRFQVIVVDDGSSLSLEPVLASFRNSFDLKLIAQTHLGPATARNTGAANAKGDFLAFTDDDCSPDPGWLKALSNRFSIAPDHLIGGQTINALTDNVFSASSQELISYLYDYYNTNNRRAPFFISNNIAVPAEHFHKIGGFDTSFPLAAGEDREFCDRWLYHGYRMTYAPEAVVYHSHALTFTRFWRQHFNYGRGAFHFHQMRAQRTAETIKIEPLSFYLNLLRYPFTRSTTWHEALPTASLLLLSQLANAAGYFFEKSKKIPNAKAKKGR